MTGRMLFVARALWQATWAGLRERGGGVREAACVWLGTRSGTVEHAFDVVYLDDLPGTTARRVQHRTSREGVDMLLACARDRKMSLVADIHTHPGRRVDLSEIDQAHPIEFRVGLLALVLPHFATTEPDITTIGLHEYAGDGRWHTMRGTEVVARLSLSSPAPEGT